MFCNKCGYQFDGNFCPKCGAKAKNAPKSPVNTSVNYSEEKDENPYNVYYNEKPYGDVSTSQTQNTYEPQFGNQPPKQDQENVGAENQQPQPPYQPYHPPYYPPQPPKDTGLKWWQILLIILIPLLVFGIISVNCVDSIYTANEAYFNEYESYNTSINDKAGFTGDTINSAYFSYTVTNAKYIKTYENKKPKDGYKFLEVTVKSVNTFSRTQYLEYELHCYADNIQYNDVNNAYYYDFGNLLPMKASVNTVVFEIAENSSSVDIYLDDYCTRISIMLTNLK